MNYKRKANDTATRSDARDRNPTPVRVGTRQYMTSGPKRLRITIEPPDSTINDGNDPHTYMIVTNPLTVRNWKDLERYKKEVQREADMAHQPVCKITLENLIDQDNERKVLLANGFARDLIKELKERIEDLRQAIDDLQKDRLKMISAHQKISSEDQKTKPEGHKISPADQADLMTRYLHHRYRTLWQMGRNTRQLPHKPLERASAANPPGARALHNHFFPGPKNEYLLHKHRYELATALGHGGNLKADILVVTSDYVDHWHTASDLPNHALYSRIVCDRLFEKIYNLDIREAQWLVDASEMGDLDLRRVATYAVRIIERYVFINDYICHKISIPEGDQWVPNPTDLRLRNLEKLQKAYEDWTDRIKDLIHPPGTPDEFIARGQCDTTEFDHLIDVFYKVVQEVSRRPQAGWIDWYMYSEDPRARDQPYVYQKDPDKQGMKLWKPAHPLQLEYDDPRWDMLY